MNAGIYTVEELAYRCSDFGEHVSKIVQQINLGNKVGGYSIARILSEVFSHGSEELVIKYAASLSVNTPISAGFAALIDDWTQETCENLARSYKGKYDE